jgi:chromosomal replication initiation ATPase DnaA
MQVIADIYQIATSQGPDEFKLEKIKTLCAMARGLQEYSIYEIADAVADEFHVDRSILFERNRRQEVAIARFVLFFVLYTYKEMPIVAIGRAFRKDHSTVIHGIKKISDLLDVDDALCRKIERVRIDLAFRW